jgi:hypothetical protein
MLKKNLNTAAVIALLFLSLCLGIGAQETTGELQGTIKDQQGAVVPNATITITGISVGFNRTTQTNEDGVYSVRQVPPGAYRVVVAATGGFAEQTKENVTVALGNATTLDFALGVANVGATVDVTADSSITVDATETKAQDNLTSQQIDALPKGTGFASLLNRTSSLRDDALSGQFTINGSTGPENSFIIDGQEVQNFRRGFLNDANDTPYQSIQELQVKTSGFEAQFGGATGGVINVVTKGGTNDWRGEFGAQFNTSKLNATPRAVYNNLTGVDTASGEFPELLQQKKDSGSNFFPTASVGGPILKDKVWFYGIYSPRFFNATRTVDYYTPNVPSARTLNGTIVVPAKTVQEYGFIRLDATPWNNVRLTSSFTWNPFYNEGLFPAGGTTIFGTVPAVNVGGGNILRGADYQATLGGRQNANSFRFEGVWTPTNNIVATLRYSRGFLNEKLNSYGITDVPRFQCVFTATATQTVAQLQALAGCANGFQTTANNNGIRKDVSIRNTIDADGSYLVGNLFGRHEFKGGYTYSKIFNDVDTGYVNTGIIRLCYGRFNTGACLGLPSGPVTFNSTSAPLGIGQLVRFGQFGSASNTAHTIYLQDKWQPTSRLTFNLGVRAEQEDLPAYNLGTVSAATGLKFNFKDKIAPRLGVAYALTADGKTKISAFYGWFYDRLKFELPRGSFGGNTFLADTFIIDPAHPNFDYYNIARVSGGIGIRPGGICPVVTPAIGTSVCQIDFRIPSNVPGLSSAFGDDVPADAGTVDPNLKPFRQSEFTFEFQREIMKSSVLTARFLYRNVDNAVEDAGFYTSNLSEFYDIANPCEGLHLEHIQALGYNTCTKPERTYKALQLEYDTRFRNNFSLNLNYTLSRLVGTFSGLANPDEAVGGVGRNSPGVNRYFDQPFIGFTASGNVDRGLLPLDRTHVFKASGTYSFNWWKSKTSSTDLSFFTTLESGTPETTFVTTFGAIPIPLTTRGDLGRTEMFTQTDINLTQRYRFGQDNRFMLAFDFNVLNLFNENNVIQHNTQYDGIDWNFEYTDVSPDIVDAVNILTSRGILDRITATQGTPQTNPSHFNAGYLYPQFFQAQRTVRFGFRFIF